MQENLKAKQEKLIKSKERVQEHGEVFTPVYIVKQMLNQEGIKEACTSLTTTFLEPAAGEGVFLVEILKRKLEMVRKDYNQNLLQFENYALLALASLYGIELLEDNTKACLLNVYKTFYAYYLKAARQYEASFKDEVLASAKTIIKANILQGDFLTRKTVDAKPLVFSEWQVVDKDSNNKELIVSRTEYALDEIYKDAEANPGRIYNGKPLDEKGSQMSLEDLMGASAELEEDAEYRYLNSKITNVYQEAVEKVDD